MQHQNGTMSGQAAALNALAAVIAKPAYAIEPQRDTFKGQPEGADGSTWFEHCEEGRAESWAVFDIREALGAGPCLVDDFPSRAAAEAWIAANTRTPALTLVIGKRKPIPVRDYADASAAYDRVRRESGLGASRLPGGTIMDGGTAVAWVSYNAKVWGSDPARHGWTPGEASLFDPYEKDRAAEKQAVDDVMEDVVLLAQETHKSLAMNERDMRRHAQEGYCTEIFDRIAARARSAGLDPARLLDLATRRLDKEHPGSPIVQVPDFLRAQMDRIAA